MNINTPTQPENRETQSEGRAIFLVLGFLWPQVEGTFVHICRNRQPEMSQHKLAHDFTVYWAMGPSFPTLLGLAHHRVT